jgi:hypothetical protein
VKGFAYSPRAGDVRYEIPGDGVWGAVFSRGADPGGARCPVQVLERSGRIYPLFRASAYGIDNATLATEELVTARGGSGEAEYVCFVGAAFANTVAATGAAVEIPTTLAGGAAVWGWTLL